MFGLKSVKSSCHVGLPSFFWLPEGFTLCWFAVQVLSPIAVLAVAVMALVIFNLFVSGVDLEFPRSVALESQPIHCDGAVGCRWMLLDAVACYWTVGLTKSLFGRYTLVNQCINVD